MSNNDQYVITPDMWESNGYSAVYIDDTTGCGFTVELTDEKHLLGSTLSPLDEDNVYYYDLSSNVYKCAPYNNFIDIELDEDGIPTEDVVTPNWFITHCYNMESHEMALEDMMCNFIDDVLELDSGDAIYSEDYETQALAYFEEHGMSKWDLWDAAYIYNYYRG